VKNPRIYGGAPFTIAVIHGGPGAPGEMAPVARQLSSFRGVLEPLQTAATLEGQIQELEAVLENKGDLPVTLIGFSWGALLGFIFTARYPSSVKKLILIGSGVYEEKYSRNIMSTRLSRLSDGDKAEALSLMDTLNDPCIEDKNTLMARLGKLISKADSYDPLPHDSEIVECQYDISQSVWGQAKELRSSGKLLELGKRIHCPVVAIHGDYDPHPPEGVRDPLSKIGRASDRFYNILRNEV